MNDDMRRLVRLQEIAFQIKELEDAKATLPDRMAVLEQAFQQKIEDIGSARLRHEALVQQERRLNQERDDIQDRLRQAQQKLMHVNNQREYSAVLNEIDSYKASISSLEDRILDCDGQIESLAGPAAEADQNIETERRGTEQAKHDLASEMDQNTQHLGDLIRQRDEIAAQLPQDLLLRFENLFRTRGGIAMARVEKGSCSACHVRLRPQVINMARRGDTVVTCDSCRRILYVDEDERDAADLDEHRAEASH